MIAREPDFSLFHSPAFRCSFFRYAGNSKNPNPFVGADLRGSNFGHADMTHANLREANLQETSLQDTALAGADLSGARLDSADLRRANFKGAILSSVIGLTQTQITAACVDGQTKLPPELSRPAPCTPAKKRVRP